MSSAPQVDYLDIVIDRQPSVKREEYLDYMTFHSNSRPLFTEFLGPMAGLKQQWQEQEHKEG